MKPQYVRLFLLILIIIVSLITPAKTYGWSDGPITVLHQILLLIAGTYFLCLPPYVVLLVLWILAILPIPNKIIIKKIIIWLFRLMLIFWTCLECIFTVIETNFLWGRWLYTSLLVLASVLELALIILEIVRRRSAPDHSSYDSQL
jgi:hypothetical protein